MTATAEMARPEISFTGAGRAGIIEDMLKPPYLLGLLGLLTTEILVSK